MEETGLAKLGDQIERLSREGEAAKYPAKVDIKLPPGKLLFRKTDGGFIPYDVGPGFADNRLDTIATAINYIEQLKIGEKGAVFVSESTAVIFPEFADQRERAHIPLDWTDQYRMLRKGETQNLAQDVFVLLLKTLPTTGPNFIKIFSNLKWGVGREGERVIEHGKDSYGAKVNAAVESGVGGNLPEEVELNIPIFEIAPDVMFTVRCAIDVRPSTQKFSLIPLPQQCTRAIDDAIKWIIEQLRSEKGPPIFRGNPKQG